MKGNFHVQFLGEGVAATSPPYPTPGWATTQVYPAHEARCAEECGLPGSIRTGNRHKNRPAIKLGELHQGHETAWNSRPTNRPCVRVPSASTRTTSPGEPGSG